MLRPIDDGPLQRINELHPAYEPLQYPMFFPTGKQGYSLQCVESQRAYYAARLMIRETNVRQIAGSDRNLIINGISTQFTPILLGRQLFQQYLDDMGSKVITNRLKWFKDHQQEIRADKYKVVRDQINNGDNLSDVGQRIILPSSYIGSPRYMHNLIQDGLALVRRFGKPTLFTTMTCDPGWEEIQSCLFPGQEPYDRPDIVARVFCLKHSLFMDWMMKKAIMGEELADLSNQEYQKRDLPHCHDLFWLDDEDEVGLGDYFLSSFIYSSFMFNFYI